MMRLLAIVGLTVVLFSACNENKEKPLNGQIMCQDINYVVLPKLQKDSQSHHISVSIDDFSIEERNKLILTYAYYGIPVKMQMGSTIQISGIYSTDTTFLWNLQKKSTDSVWFEDHLLK